MSLWNHHRIPLNHHQTAIKSPLNHHKLAPQRGSADARFLRPGRCGRRARASHRQHGLRDATPARWPSWAAITWHPTRGEFFWNKCDICDAENFHVHHKHMEFPWEFHHRHRWLQPGWFHHETGWFYHQTRGFHHEKWGLNHQNGDRSNIIGTKPTWKNHSMWFTIPLRIRNF